MMSDTPHVVEEELVLREDRGRVAILAFNRPDRLNAWNRTLENRYFDLLAELDAEPEIRAIVVTGAGRAFCAGADVADLAAAAGGDGPAEKLRRPRYFPLTVGTPIVAAVNGPAVGFGLAQALFCDVRFAAEDAKIGALFPRRGLVAEFGTAPLLVRQVGRGRALDLLLSGRIVSGAEALGLGLVEFAAPPEELLERAVAYADELAELSSPWSMATIKAQVADAVERPFVESFEESLELMGESIRRPDVKEGVAAFTERRPPRFPPRQSGDPS
jgi:enoyl-CoA hydratase/carnithine racemase